MDRIFWIPAIAGSIFLVYIFAWTLIHIGSQFDKSLEERISMKEKIKRLQLKDLEGNIIAWVSLPWIINDKFEETRVIAVIGLYLSDPDFLDEFDQNIYVLTSVGIDTYKLKQVLKDIIENGWINYHLEDE